ncbi:hypothetical protein [Roseibium salinum]|uniref:Uncharacterized protein n=1 Tax=Roseibium salinum TaxID=1604349 RepID=A0ABT3QXC0_9HYPH|nr:hypothetical protein [Roseibium sp. DSM 29163]MCX2721574.1 hypothetical protein [Roseibium sp. DSM 29163]MDN3722043.1 hypothetical protein [Roseibium salinum]
MLPENISAIVARNERWTGHAASEPYEAGWAREAVIFVRAVKDPVGEQPKLRVEISPDGMHWIAEGTEVQMPSAKDGLAAARLTQFGGWLRVSADFADGSEATVLVTIHLKA